VGNALSVMVSGTAAGPEKAIAMVLLEVSVLLMLLTCMVTLAVVLRRAVTRRTPPEPGEGERSTVPDQLLDAEQTVTRQLLTGGIVRSEFRHAMAELARQNSGYRRVT
jgi:hypothetical protein